MTKEWQKEKNADKLSGKTLVITCGREAYQLVFRSCWTSDWSRLISRRSGHLVTIACSSCQEIKVCCGNNRIRIEDTYVLVLCLAFKSFIPSSMFIKCSSQTRVKYLDVSRIVERIGASTCKSLPGFHAFTGCDTVSAFQRRGRY